MDRFRKRPDNFLHAVRYAVETVQHVIDFEIPDHISQHRKDKLIIDFILDER